MARTDRWIVIALAALLFAGCTSTPEETAAEEAAAAAEANEAAKAADTEAAAEAAEAAEKTRTQGGPELPSAVPEAFKPTIFLDFAGSAGEYDHNTEGGGGFADGDTLGAYASLQLEALGGVNWGAGFAFEGIRSDDDLFEHSGFPDSDGEQLDVFVYMLGIAHETDTFRLPIRMGPYVHQTSISEDSTDLDFDWNAIGLRFEAEPEEWVSVGENFSWGLYASGSIGVHRTFIEAESGTFSADYNGRGMTWGGGFGLQALFGQHIKARLGYLLRQTEERDSHSDLGVFVNEMSASFDGLVFEVGMRF